MGLDFQRFFSGSVFFSEGDATRAGSHVERPFGFPKKDGDVAMVGMEWMR